MHWMNNMDYNELETQIGADAGGTTSPGEAAMAELISRLLLARNVAQMWHWKVKSFAMHMALGELYNGLDDMADELMEMYMGHCGTGTHIELSLPNHFSETDPIQFICELHAYLCVQHDLIPQIPFLVNKFEELQALVSTVKYKLENLK